MRIENSGSVARGTRVARILDGKTMDDVMAWLSSGGDHATAPVKMLGGVTPLPTAK